jgi:PAT family beta-lactamase induction signal transducer AmpG
MSPALADDPRLDRVPLAYLILFVLLYAVQGVVFAYFINFNQAYMLAGGVAPQRVGDVQSLALLPFVFKFLAGPLSDRFSLLGLGHRKPYILLGLLVQAAGLVGLSLVHPGQNLSAFTAVAIITVAGLALYDTCTDGLIVTITPPGDRARVQGLLMGARFFAATLFALLFGFWLDRTGAGPGRGDGVLWVCAALSFVPLAMALILPEPRRSLGGEAFQWQALAVMVRPRSLVLLAFGTFYAIVAYGVEINLPVFYDHLGFGQGDVGTFGALRNLGRAAGSLLLPLGAIALGRRWVLRLAVVGLMLTEAAQAGVFGHTSAGAAGFLFGAANGWTDALYYVMAMEASDPRLAASTYALFMAVSNLSVTGGSLFSRLNTALGGEYRAAFLAAAAVTGLALFLIRPLGRPALTVSPAPPPEPADVVLA